MEGMAEQPYRGTHETLDAEARSRHAVREVGRWRDRMRMGVVLGFVLAGLGVAVVVIQLVQPLMPHTLGVGFLRIAMLVGIATWVAMIALGKVVAGQLVRVRTAAAVARIAARYQVPRDELERDTRVDGLK